MSRYCRDEEHGCLSLGKGALQVSSWMWHGKDRQFLGRVAIGNKFPDLSISQCFTGDYAPWPTNHKMDIGLVNEILE